jgi:type I restriction enzyme, R subunit
MGCCSLRERVWLSKKAGPPLTTSLKREYASDSGTELNTVLPKMSPLNPLYLTKKQSVFQKIAAFVEKFKGVGGQI